MWVLRCIFDNLALLDGFMKSEHVAGLRVYLMGLDMGSHVAGSQTTLAGRCSGIANYIKPFAV